MAARVGKIITVRNKFAGPRDLHVNTVGEALRKHTHMCFQCKLFKPGDKNCAIARQIEHLSHENTIGLTLVRCPLFVEKGEDHDGRKGSGERVPRARKGDAGG